MLITKHPVSRTTISPRAYDLITVAFGLETLLNQKNLTNIYNSLQPGGQFLIMDFKPRTKIYSSLFKFTH